MVDKRMKGLKKAIIELLKSEDRLFSVGDILEGLEEIDTKPSTVRQALRSLETEKRIISFVESKDDVGRPKKFYRTIEKDVAVHKSVTREAYDRQTLLRGLVEDSAGRYSTIPVDEVSSIFRTAAKKLLSENPRYLFIEFAKWLKGQHESEVDLYKECRDKGLRNDAEKHLRNIVALEKCANEIFTRMLGVPAQIRQEDGTLKSGPFLLKLDKRKLKDFSNLEATKLKKYVDMAVHGSYVIEKFPLETPKPPIRIGGSDSSIQSIALSGLLPWMVERSEMNIITAVGVRYDIFKNTRDFDRYPEPKVLAQYERSQAIQEGLLIPPAGSLGYRPEMENRIKEAAMDLRQYIKDFDLMFRHEPAAKIHFRDGRIFPYEHRLSDALQVGFHGDMVRMSLKAFRNIVNIVGTENGEVLYCGFVKRPGTRILAPLIMWYIGFGSRRGSEGAIDQDITFNDFLRSPYSDNYIINQLFSTIRDLLGDNEVYLTFRLLRRFQAMEEPYVQNFEPTDSRSVWAERLQRFSEQIFGSGSEESGAEIIAGLCSRGSIVQFYCSLSIDPEFEPHAQLPRFEFLLPYPDLSKTLTSPEQAFKRQNQYIKKILSVIFSPDVLTDYQDSLFYFTSQSPEFFLAPKPVTEAHESAKEIAKVYRDDFVELLIREARVYWLERTHAGLRPTSKRK